MLKIVTKPRGRKVRYIEALYYSFCTAQGVDPKKFRECDLWNVVSDGDEKTFSGAYYYQVSREDNSYTEPERKDFGGAPDSMTTWVIR